MSHADLLTRLMHWYQSNCNGAWEHQYGITIDTIDNPGWTVKIDLAGTAYAEKEFMTIRQDNSESDWLSVEKRGSVFQAYGDPNKLAEILRQFIHFVES